MSETLAPPAGAASARVSQRGFLHRLLRRPTAVVSLGFLLLVTVASLCAPLLAPADPLDQDLAHVLSTPSAAHLLGTDSSGFDILGIPADPSALTVFRLRIDNGYSVLSFNTDTSLKVTDGFDTITGNGVPNGTSLQAFVAGLTAPPPPAPPSN